MAQRHHARLPRGPRKRRGPKRTAASRRSGPSCLRRGCWGRGRQAPPPSGARQSLGSSQAEPLVSALTPAVARKSHSPNSLACPKRTCEISGLGVIRAWRPPCNTRFSAAWSSCSNWKNRNSARSASARATSVRSSSLSRAKAASARYAVWLTRPTPWPVWLSKHWSAVISMPPAPTNGPPASLRATNA